MPVPPDVMKLLLLVPMAAFIMYYDVRYRRIPNVLVLSLLIGGLTINISFGGFDGALASVEGFGLAFLPMFLIHLFGAMGAGDVKLFGAVGSVIGVSMVPLTFVVVVMLGAAARYLHDATFGNRLFNTTRRFKNLCRHHARLGDAALRNAKRSETHHSLWRRHHAGQPDRSGPLSGVNPSRSF